MAASRQPHAVMIPVPSHGHVTPMLQLAQRLASSGFFITFISLDSITSGLISTNSDTNLQFLPISVNTDVPVDSADQWLFTIVELIRPPVELLLQEVKNKEPPITFFIVDGVISWAQDVADGVGVPRVSFWAMSAIFHSLLFFFDPLLARYRPMPNSEEPVNTEGIITCIPGLAPVVRLIDFPLVFFPDTLYEYFKRNSALMKRASAAIVHSVYEIESSSVDALRQVLPIYTVGPLFPLDPKSLKFNVFEEEDACLTWLNSRDPLSVLYVSFGTSVILSEADLKEIALGLEASEQPFLWVYRPRKGVDFSISDIFSDKTKCRSMIVSWAPQLSVLQHPSVGGFLSPCGWNSTFESIYMGVPMLGLPRIADQKVNLRYISQVWKIGIPLENANDGSTVKRDAVEEGVRALFNGEEGKGTRRRILEMKKLVRMAGEDGGSSHKQLAKFVTDMTRRVNEAATD